MRSPLAAIFLAAVTLAATLPVMAQSGERPRPPGTRPLEEPPPPPAMVEPDPALKPEITTRKEGDTTVEEFRIKGKLYMKRFTTPGGRPYVMIDQRGDGSFNRQDTLSPHLSVPQWVLLEF